MAGFLIEGGRKLRGEIKLGGNKNSALKLMADALLAEFSTTLTTFLRDIDVMVKLIIKPGAKVDGLGTNTLTIDPTYAFLI